MSEPEGERETAPIDWDRQAEGWARRADRVREIGMPVSVWMIDHLGLQPGQRVLELAAGPGDTGFLAAELIAPGGTLICSDAFESMLDVARSRAGAQSVTGVEFKRLELEWIDLPAASVDAALCRWGLMLVSDPGAGAREMRRVLRPGGRAAVAVWDAAAQNPWATIPTRALVGLGHVDSPAPSGPGMFALAPASKLQRILEDAGFVDVRIETVELPRSSESLDALVAETLDLSKAFADVWGRLDEDQRRDVVKEIESLAAPFTADDGRLVMPGCAIVALANA